MGAERFSGKVAIVTGSGSGLGRAIAKRIATEGGAVVVADIDPDGAARTTEEIVKAAGKATSFTVDVSVEASVMEMADAAVETFGSLDVLYNNAAALSPEVVGQDNDLLDLDVAVWDKTMAVNLRGVMLGCKHAIPHMLRAGGGAIVNTSSTAAFEAGTRNAAYGTSKAGIISFTRYVAAMYGSQNIRCNAVAPGHMENPETAAREGSETRSVIDYERLLPNRATPDDVAAVAVFLGSDDAGCVTGQVYVADGGRLAQRAAVALNRALADLEP